MPTVLVTGGAGFIGSAFTRNLLSRGNVDVVNIDKLTYAGNVESLANYRHHPRHLFIRGDICDGEMVRKAFQTYEPAGVVHLAAESHVDRSIDNPGDFIHTNVVGTYTLLREALAYWRKLSHQRRSEFRFVHVSTDEVFGSLDETGSFSETTKYDPRSPYSASKAGSDHLARAWWHTYGFPTIVTNCSNNYGPYQFPEKLIPLVIQKALRHESIPVYGAGANVRDWLYVEDHVRALELVLERGAAGETYNIGGNNERRNLEVATIVCDIVDQLVSPDSHGARRRLITFVADRPGHDYRYAIDASKIRRELGWTPQESFESGVRKTVEWYIAHGEWCERIRSGAYRGERLGLLGQT